eukprot:jgi/Antlo1/464/2109
MCICAFTSFCLQHKKMNLVLVTENNKDLIEMRFCLHASCGQRACQEKCKSACQ